MKALVGRGASGECKWVRMVVEGALKLIWMALGGMDGLGWV